MRVVQHKERIVESAAYKATGASYMGQRIRSACAYQRMSSDQGARPPYFVFPRSPTGWFTRVSDGVVSSCRARFSRAPSRKLR